MEGEGSWDIYNPTTHLWLESASFRTVSDSKSTCEIGAISLDNVLPDDILERIISFLPVASILRASSVCRRWYDIVKYKRFVWAVKTPQKPWYFMFTGNEVADGYAYDPVLRKWYKIELPCIDKDDWFITSSCGLVCFMDRDSRTHVFVCNPVTKDWRKLFEPPGVQFPDYSSLALSADRDSHAYTVVVTKSKQVPGDFMHWELYIHIYESESDLWIVSIKEVLMGWRGGDESVICDGVLYCLIYSTAIVGNAGVRHGLIAYDLRASSSRLLIETLIPAPCPLTCGRLMNLKNRLVMVGGIAKYDRPDIIKGIGIWEFYQKKWHEIARMPHKFFQGFGELDDVFASSGYDDLIYIQSYGSPALLIFDMEQKQWKWSMKSPLSKRFPLQLFSGFCFEPRLEISS